MTKRLVALCMVLTLCFVPMTASGAFAQVSEAHAQAERDVNGMTWLAAGLFGGVIGWFFATQTNPEPPATALLGKSPDYVAQYRDAYKERSRQIASKQALTGCLIGGAAGVLLVVLSAGAAASAY